MRWCGLAGRCIWPAGYFDSAGSAKDQRYPMLGTRRLGALGGIVTPPVLHEQAQMTLERLYRQTVAADAPARERRMTAEQLFRRFDNCGVLVEHHNYGELVHASGLTRQQRKTIHQLSFETPAKIISRTLPAPPVP